MSNVEIFIVVCACLIPIIALAIVLPRLSLKKKKSKSKQPEIETKPYVPTQPIAPVQSEPKQVKPARAVDNTSYTKDDFKDYLKDKQSRIGHPVRNSLPDGYIDRTEGLPPRFEQMNKSSERTEAEQLKSLSPEIMALILAGVLDKKDF